MEEKQRFWLYLDLHLRGSSRYGSHSLGAELAEDAKGPFKLVEGRDCHHFPSGRI